jgi:hypothetical protein
MLANRKIDGYRLDFRNSANDFKIRHGWHALLISEPIHFIPYRLIARSPNDLIAKQQPIEIVEPELAAVVDAIVDELHERVGFEEDNAADGRTAHEAGQLVEILLPKSVTDDGKIDFVDARQGELAGVPLGVLAKLSVVGTQHIAAPPHFGVDDHREPFRCCHSQAIGHSPESLPELTHVETKAAKRLGAALLKLRRDGR